MSGSTITLFLFFVDALEKSLVLGKASACAAMSRVTQPRRKHRRNFNFGDIACINSLLQAQVNERRISNRYNDICAVNTLFQGSGLRAHIPRNTLIPPAVSPITEYSSATPHRPASRTHVFLHVQTSGFRSLYYQMSIVCLQEEMAAMNKLGPKVEVSPASKRLWQELKQEMVSSATPKDQYSAWVVPR